MLMRETIYLPRYFKGEAKLLRLYGCEIRWLGQRWFFKFKESINEESIKEESIKESIKEESIKESIKEESIKEFKGKRLFL